ncbi:FAD:protein FMN transferase [Thalassococcus sp. CAU 1522]|uniref:FAD:protein FMN transferase n=1 Tax=Thalassococcus arenae TaxID=2851652 RepID=A0ABS6NBS8_9RHOB|nr:FAD:protein FMN transferase [Thalassococcus arenae]MBV2361005.1 FAD:protein FMN transferase [Thalassococcus arenae]
MRRRRFLALAAAFACAPGLARAETWRGFALGAEVSVTLEGPPRETHRTLADIPAMLDRIEDLFSLYRETSSLSRLNGSGHLRRPDKRFLALMRQADAAHRLTGGLFDPTVQPLWHAHATGADTAWAQSLVAWRRVRFDAAGIVLGRHQALTFNGIAQGYATDLVCDLLRQRGFTRTLVDIGEQAALGGPYRLGLADPVFGAVGQRSVTDGAIATSSPGALRLGTAHHILGPHGEDPLWSTVSIEAASATLADALSTAAVFMPLERLQRLKADAALTRITVIDASGRLRSL